MGLVNQVIMPFTIFIDEKPYEAVDYQYLHYDLPIILLTLDNGEEWIVAQTFEDAGLAAATYWENLSYEDPDAFIAAFEAKTLVTWLYGYQETFEDWLEYMMDNPYLHWADDNTECYVGEISDDLVELIGFVPTVAYKWV